MATSDLDGVIAAPAVVDRGLDSPASPQRREDLGLETPFAAPASDTERRIAATWKEALGIDRVGLDDNFFELGGDSLGLTHILIHIRGTWNVDFPIERFFDEPTVRELAAAVDDATEPPAAGGHR